MGTMGKVDAPYASEVADGVFAYIQPDGTWFLNNSGIIIGPESVIMIDQAGTEDRGRALLATALRLGGGKPIQALVNTHHHADHTFANFVVGPGTAIVGLDKCRTEVIATGTGIKDLFVGPEWGDLVIRPPMITFDSTLTLWSGNREIRLIHFAGPAHTTNDVAVHLPDDKVLYTGDLIFNGGTPFALQGSVVGWLLVLDQMLALDAETLIAGHGPVCSKDAAAPVRAYLEFVLDLARHGIDAGQTPIEVAMESDLGRFASLGDPERIAGNLHRAYHDLRHPEDLGATLDLGPIIGDMITYNGGPIRSHA